MNTFTNTTTFRAWITEHNFSRSGYVDAFSEEAMNEWLTTGHAPVAETAMQTEARQLLQMPVAQYRAGIAPQSGIPPIEEWKALDGVEDSEPASKKGKK